MRIIPGTFVRLRQDPARAGELLEGEKLSGEMRMVQVRFADGRPKWLPLSALEPVPSNSESLWDRFIDGRFAEPEWLRRALTRLRVTGRLSEVVYSMEATETDFYAYQFKPVIKLMNSPTDALLIADEVGLGKTIEAGLVWTELRARLGCDRLLVACPKTLCRKWQEELARRFGVDAQIANARHLLNTLKKTRDTGRGFAVVCSMQGLRPPRGWDKDNSESEGVPHSSRRDLARFLDEESDGDPLVDLLIVDEAHHMRNPETLLYRFGSLANSVASHRLFLSATPIHLGNRDLHSLLALVDPDTFEFENTLNELIATNAPIIAARDMLLKSDSLAPEILRTLDETQSHEIIRQSKALAQIRLELKEYKLDPWKRSELAARLEKVNQLANYVSRTRRRDVEEFRVIREPKTPVLNMHADERVFYEEISKVVQEYAKHQNKNELFLLSTPQRLLTSSLAAASAYWGGLKTEADYDEVEETDHDLDDQSLNDRPVVTQIAEKVRSLSMTERLTEVDGKYGTLISELRKLWELDSASKVIVFSSFIPTLRYLRNRLQNEGIGVEILHGSVKRSRADILARFEGDHDTPILLSSEVGSEGLDLQFSSVVVNYDLPWNPMRLEQRIGRVDRLGQTKEKVEILNLIYENTIDKRIYDRLYDRLEIGQRALGEMEAILGPQIHQMTITLLDPNLSDSQKENVIDQTATALENKRHQEKQLESEAGSLIQHGDYILERITESRNRHRWLSGEDILIYVRDRILHDFPGSVIETSPVGTDTYRIVLSPDGNAAFQAYLTRHDLKGRTRLLNADARQRFRFTSSVVQNDGRVECISQLHPLVRFAAERDRQDDAVLDSQAVAAKVTNKSLPTVCDLGLYVLAARHWSTGNIPAGILANVQVGYAGAKVASRKRIGEDLAEQMMSAAAEVGRPLANASNLDGLAEAAATFRDVVRPELDQRFGDFVSQAEAEIEDRVTIRLRALDRHFRNKLATLEKHQENLRSQALDQNFVDSLFGESRRARNLKNLADAQGARIDKLKRIWDRRQKEITDQRKIVPEESDLCCLLLQVCG